ncbi:FkbM family methyltransferase [Massilia sp. TS11]|uniref:FkbM family methyltransferase n=1 Tax=Massilia sp. TS11 TaxID=2908003 RepID=UPI001EDB3CA5|nr:FkbM family methyltransferase [Massilia sp. TS11]MCG2582834.1 FkbM family methyltransferase [Massilia sp. TS11]
MVKKFDERAEAFVGVIFDDYYAGSKSAEKYIQHDWTAIKFEPPAAWLRDTYLHQGHVHDEDLRIFRCFNDPETCVIDVGANWGYSVTSLWAVGVQAKIFSFEVNPMNRDCLDVIRNFAPDRYDFDIVGLGDHTNTLKFVIPLCNNIPIAALCSASSAPNTHHLARNVVSHMRTYCRDDDIDVGIFTYTTEVRSLDSYIAGSACSFLKGPIAAIKIDVEGLESKVLAGSVLTLSQHKPLIMLEGANRDPEVRAIMQSLGYLFANRDGDKLVLHEEISGNVNGFFVHKNLLNSYRDLGILTLA